MTFVYFSIQLYRTNNNSVPLFWSIFDTKQEGARRGGDKMAAEEPWLTYLMPVSSAINWMLILSDSGKDSWVLPTSLFGALWAVRNMLITKRLDLGAITMGLVASADTVGRLFGHGTMSRATRLVGCVLVAANYALPLLMWSTIKKMFAKSKSIFWLKVFYYHCCNGVVFWIIGAMNMYNKQPKIN